MSQNVSLTNGDHLKLAIYHLEQLSAPDLPHPSALSELSAARSMSKAHSSRPVR